MLPDKIVNSKLLKEILWIRVFDLSVILVGCRRSGVKKYEHIALQNCELPDSMLIFIKLLLKLSLKKPNFSSPFSFFKIGVTYFELKSAIDMLRLLLFTCCSLLVEIHLLLVAKSASQSLQKLLILKSHSLLVAKFARYSLQKLLVAKNHLLLVAEVAYCKKSLVVAAKFACYSLQKLLIVKNHSLVVAKFTRYSLQKLLVVKSHSLFFEKFARCKNSLVVKNNLLLVAKLHCYLLHKFTKKSQLNLVMNDKV